jgi:DNA-binding MarR family transcriptional regulator
VLAAGRAALAAAGTALAAPAPHAVSVMTMTQATGGQASPRPDGLAEAIARLRRALRRGARVADPANTLAVAQLELLTALAEQPSARPGQLARRLNMRPNTVTTIVNALATQGMLNRVAAEDDRRAVELTVTEAGQQAVLAWQATNAAVLNLALSALPAQQRRALAAAVPALQALAGEIDRLADTPQDQDSR